jgi:hypothetical protein
MEEKSEETQDTKPSSTLRRQAEPAGTSRNQKNTTTERQMQCEIYSSILKDINEIEMRRESWPVRLIMQLMPRAAITSVGGHLLRVS